MGLAAVMLAALALASSAASSVGDWATASASGTTTITLRLHYLMTCGQPGEGPVEIGLPSALHLVQPVSVFVNGKPQLTISGAHSVTVQLPKPPQLTCMSIGPGVLTLTLRGVRIPATTATYMIRASIGARNFTAQLRR